MCTSAVLFCFQTSYSPDLLEGADSIGGQMCGDKAAPSVAYPVMAEFGRRVVESMALSVAHCIFHLCCCCFTDSHGREVDVVTPKRHFFTERRMKERSGCGHTTEDFFTERQLKERSGCGRTREIQTSKRLYIIKKTALFNWTTQNLWKCSGQTPFYEFLNYFLLVMQVFLIVFMWCFSNTIYLPSFVDNANTQSRSLLQAMSLEGSSWVSANIEMHFTQGVPSVAQYWSKQNMFFLGCW